MGMHLARIALVLAISAFKALAGDWEATPAIDLGGGANSLGHATVHTAMGVNYDRIFVSARARGSSEFPLFLQKEPAETTIDLGILTGRFWNSTFAYASIGTGLSVLRFKERTSLGRKNPDCNGVGLFCADSTFETRTIWTPGIPIEAMASLKLWYFGVGLRVYGNTNFRQSFGGASAVLFLGGGPTQPKRRPQGSGLEED